MTTTQINTAELSGAALDWAVAKAQCPESFRDHEGPGELSSWSQGWLQSAQDAPSEWTWVGPLIRQHKIDVTFCFGDVVLAKSMKRFATRGEQTDKNPLIAIKRAAVAAILGDKVHVPTELVEGGV